MQFAKAKGQEQSVRIVIEPRARSTEPPLYRAVALFPASHVFLTPLSDAPAWSRHRTALAEGELLPPPGARTRGAVAAPADN
jgi:hypothetical protein